MSDLSDLSDLYDLYDLSDLSDLPDLSDISDLSVYIFVALFSPALWRSLFFCRRAPMLYTKTDELANQGTKTE